MPKKPVEPDFDAFAEEHADALANALRNRQVVNPETGKAWTWRDIRRIAGAAGISPSEMKEMTLAEMIDFLKGVLDMKQAEAGLLAKAIRAGHAAAAMPDDPDKQEGEINGDDLPPCPDGVGHHTHETLWRALPGGWFSTGDLQRNRHIALAERTIRRWCQAMTESRYLTSNGKDAKARQYKNRRMSG